MSAGGELRLRPTTAFAKDLKRAGKQAWDTSLLQALIEHLRLRRPLEPRHRDHALKGERKGWRDCHVRDDWVLIYKVDERRGELVLGRTGTHQDLFGS